MIVSRSSIRVVQVVVADGDRRRCYEYYECASSIYFSGRCPFELLSERCRLDLQGKNFFVGQWCHGLVGECTPGFFCFWNNTESLR